jgi:hypothetical protein
MQNKKQRNREDINFKSVASVISPHWASPMPNCMQSTKAVLVLSGLSPRSADPKADVTNGLAAEAFFQFSQNFGLGNLFELVVQGRLTATPRVRATLVSSDATT